MSLNIDESSKIGINGLAITDDDGQVIFYLASGSGSPVGQSAPINTFYTNTDDSVIWRKFDSGDDDWDTQVMDDYHSSMVNIPLTETLLIREGKQMIVFNTFNLDGILNLEGDLWLA